MAVSKKLAANCTPAELKEIEDWVKRHQGVDELKRKVAALTLAEQIGAAVKWFKHASDEEIAPIAEDVLAASTALRRVLARRNLT